MVISQVRDEDLVSSWRPSLSLSLGASGRRIGSSRASRVRRPRNGKTTLRYVTVWGHLLGGEQAGGVRGFYIGAALTQASLILCQCVRTCVSA